MDHIRDSLSKRLNQRSLSVTARAAYVCYVANELAAGRYVAQSFRAGILTIAAPSSAAAQDLKFARTTLQQTLNDRMKHPSIQEIRVIVGGQ